MRAIFWLQVQAYLVDPSGSLTISQNLPAPARNYAIVYNGNQKFIYVSMNVASNLISTYTADSTTGNLTHLTDTVLSSNTVADLKFDPTGKFLFAVSEAASPSFQLFSYFADPNSGALTL